VQEPGHLHICTIDGPTGDLIDTVVPYGAQSNDFIWWSRPLYLSLWFGRRPGQPDNLCTRYIGTGCSPTITHLMLCRIWILSNSALAATINPGVQMPHLQGSMLQKFLTTDAGRQGWRCPHLWSPRPAISTEHTI
jgi:hypothetical protein